MELTKLTADYEEKLKVMIEEEETGDLNPIREKVLLDKARREFEDRGNNPCFCEMSECPEMELWRFSAQKSPENADLGWKSGVQRRLAAGLRIPCLLVADAGGGHHAEFDAAPFRCCASEVKQGSRW